MEKKYSEREIEIVKQFCDTYFWILILRHYFKCLFEDFLTPIHSIYARAGHFFNDLNRLFINHFLLQVAKITDPPQTLGKYNLSVRYILENIHWPDDIKKKLMSYSENMHSFREYILDARNKILSHNDLETSILNSTLGSFPEGADQVFLRALGEFAEQIHRTCIGVPFNPVKTFPGDVHDFIKVLKYADAFNRFLEDNPDKKGELLLKYVL